MLNPSLRLLTAPKQHPEHEKHQRGLFQEGETKNKVMMEERIFPVFATATSLTPSKDPGALVTPTSQKDIEPPKPLDQVTAETAKRKSESRKH